MSIRAPAAATVAAAAGAAVVAPGSAAAVPDGLIVLPVSEEYNVNVSGSSTLAVRVFAAPWGGPVYSGPVGSSFTIGGVLPVSFRRIGSI